MLLLKTRNLNLYFDLKQLIVNNCGLRETGQPLTLIGEVCGAGRH